MAVASFGDVSHRERCGFRNDQRIAQRFEIPAVHDEVDGRGRPIRYVLVLGVRDQQSLHDGRCPDGQVLDERSVFAELVLEFRGFDVDVFQESALCIEDFHGVERIDDRLGFRDRHPRHAVGEIRVVHFPDGRYDHARAAPFLGLCTDVLRRRDDGSFVAFHDHVHQRREMGTGAGECDSTSLMMPWMVHGTCA